VKSALRQAGRARHSETGKRQCGCQPDKAIDRRWIHGIARQGTDENERSWMTFGLVHPRCHRIVPRGAMVARVPALRACREHYCDSAERTSLGMQSVWRALYLCCNFQHKPDCYYN
jgi:hypothetical protein